MKKLISIAMAGALVLSMATAAFAVKPDTNVNPGKSTAEKAPNEKKNQAEDKKAENQERKAEMQASKEAAAAKRDALNKMRDENNELAKQNGALREELSAALEALKAGEQELDPAIAEQLMQYKERMQAVITSYAETKGDLKAELEANKALAQNSDYKGIEQRFINITAVLTARNQRLVELNTILKEMVALVK